MNPGVPLGLDPTRDIGNIAYDAKRLVYPIPQREMETNDNLQQNPGYGG